MSLSTNASGCTATQKPWMTKEVRTLLKARNAAFRSKDKALYSVARSNLKRAIEGAKENYKKEIEVHFTHNDPRRIWQDIQHLTDYKTSNHKTADANASLAEELNCFFARFEVRAAASAETVTSSTPASSSHTLMVQEHEVRRELRAVNTRKAAGPDGVTGRVLRECADQLSGVFTEIFNLSLSKAIIPSCLKSTTIIPLPKKPVVSSLNDYRPVALTPVIMKCLEKLVQQHIKASLPATFDPHQFAYRSNRCTEDAITTALHTAVLHLERQGSYVRMLFIDYSSAFNTVRLTTDCFPR